MQPAQSTKQQRGTRVHASIGIAMLMVTACSGREVPATWPEASAASPAAPAAPLAPVTLALAGPPPLPGEASSWLGLAPPSGAAGHAHESDAAVRYTCPMHPDVVADQPGRCPRCGMALVKRDAPK